MKIENLINDNGNATANQFVLTYPNGNIKFQSYKSNIALWDGNKLKLSKKWDFSQTTSKYLYQFIRKYTPYSVREKKDILEMIKDEEIKVCLRP